MSAIGHLALLEHRVEEGINIFFRKYFWHKIHIIILPLPMPFDASVNFCFIFSMNIPSFLPWLIMVLFIMIMILMELTARWLAAR